jgi:four helix bundle protein
MPKTYKDLEIYQLSYALAVEVHGFSLKLPTHELYEEGGQLRRSSKGIVSCIAEGYGRKRYKAEFIRFLVFAHASCDESISHLNLIKDIYEGLKHEAGSLVDSYEELGGKINRFIDYVEKHWKNWEVIRAAASPGLLATSGKL